MPNVELPPPIVRYFATKGGEDAEAALACFTDDAMVWDNGEDLEIRGIPQIRAWMTDTTTGYKLTSEVKACETLGEEFVATVVASGDFPGSPYEFAYRFKLRGDKIAELAINPIGSLAQ